jgi:hypothetical protein
MTQFPCKALFGLLTADRTSEYLLFEKYEACALCRTVANEEHTAGQASEQFQTYIQRKLFDIPWTIVHFQQEDKSFVHN